MTALEFLRSAPVIALLERAALGAGVPVSIHFLERNQEGPKVMGWGQCAACRHVQELPGGRTACRLSRTTAASMALQQNRPMAFLCHLGFACVSAPLLPGDGYILTLGPYCPMEEQRSLEEDIKAGFRGLTGGEAAADEALPVTLNDIHRAPSTAVPAIADWIVEAVRTAWDAAQRDDGEPGEDEEPVDAPAHGTGGRRDRTIHHAADNAPRALAAALTAGSLKRARSLILGELEETARSGGQRLDVRRARAASLAGAAIGAVARAGVPAAAAWADYGSAIRAIATAESDAEIADAALEAFRFLRGAETRDAVGSALPNYPELFALVKDRLPDGVTLEEVAAELGETPSAITHRLQRKFGMSFSEYMARLRTDRAKQLFRRTSLGVSDVARRVGIGDQSNFARLFRKVEGMSPAAYRKQYGKK